MYIQVQQEVRQHRVMLIYICLTTKNIVTRVLVKKDVQQYSVSVNADSNEHADCTVNVDCSVFADCSVCAHCSVYIGSEFDSAQKESDSTCSYFL